MKMKLRACVAAATVVVCGAFASTAQAVPVGFWGVVPQSNLSQEQFQRLADGGVESIRLPFTWGSIQPNRNGEYQWGEIDSQIEAAAKTGIAVLPVLSGAPTWAVPAIYVSGTGHKLRAPAHLPTSGSGRAAWIAFITAAVARYGPSGSFWSEHPTVPKLSIRTWQIWNEPNFKYFIAKPNPAEYGQLVKISYSAIKLADPGAKLVLAGLFARPKGSETAAGKHKSMNWSAKNFLEQMYKSTPGVKTKFNGVALHPYTIRYRELTPEIEAVRGVLAENHDGAKGIWITELGWSSEPPDPAVDQFAKGVAGQARELKGALTLLRNKQVKWRIKQVYWFSVDDASGACNFCGGSGLFASGFKPKKAWYEFVKLTGGSPF